MERRFFLNLSESDYQKLAYQDKRKTSKVSPSQTERDSKITMLEKYCKEHEALDASLLEEDWFPYQENCQVFISHSHKDLDKAADKITPLINWLDDLGLRCFVDSWVWQYAQDMQKVIDNAFCKKNNGYYDYNASNQSAAIVYAMLSMSLLRMLDSCNCIFFIKTENSIIQESESEREKGAETGSPWIYIESIMSRFIRIKGLEALNEDHVAVMDAKPTAPKVRFKCDFSDMEELTLDKLSEWREKARSEGKRGVNSLNKLYELFPFTPKRRLRAILENYRKLQELEL